MAITSGRPPFFALFPPAVGAGFSPFLAFNPPQHALKLFTVESRRRFDSLLPGFKGPFTESPRLCSLGLRECKCAASGFYPRRKGYFFGHVPARHSICSLYTSQRIVSIMIAIWISYLIFLTMREELTGSALNRKAPSGAGGLFPPSTAPLAISRANAAAIGAEAAFRRAQQDEDLPEFLDLSPEDFAIYFEAFERKRAELLGLKPGEPVPPLNSKASSRKRP